MEIYVFDKNIELLGLLENYNSLQWIRRYSECGSFEIHCSINKTNLALLQKDNIVFKNDGTEAGVIEFRHMLLDEKGIETLVVKGKFLSGALGRRIIWGIENVKDSSELAIRRLVNNHAINPSDPDRKLGLFELGDIKGIGSQLDFQVSYKNLLEQIEKMSTADNIGFKTILDLENKKMVFSLYQGVDRTVNQGINPPAIFSMEFENVLEQEYIESLLEYRNAALIAGQGEGVDRELVSIGNDIGSNRYEVFVDANEIDQQDLSLAEYREKLINKGNEELMVSNIIETFETSINLRSNLEYKVDFDLGDLVTVNSKKWGLTIDTRITEIIEVYESEGMSIQARIGSKIPDILDKIKEVVS